MIIIEAITLHKVEILPKHFGSVYLHFPSIWQTVDVFPSNVIPS